MKHKNGTATSGSSRGGRAKRSGEAHDCSPSLVRRRRSRSSPSARRPARQPARSAARTSSRTRRRVRQGPERRPRVGCGSRLDEDDRAFGAASYTGFGLDCSTPPRRARRTRGKNYFFGGTSPARQLPASVGTQTIKVPAGAAGHKATLSGWLGNYSNDTAQVRAEFMDASGKMISAVRIGPDTTIGGATWRCGRGAPPSRPGTASIAVVITFTDHNNANQAGADDISLVLS